MRRIISIKYIFMWVLTPLLLASCFSDEGNYDYKLLKAPTWLINPKTTPIQIRGRGGQMTVIDGSKAFTWGNLDSLERSQEVRYEWTFNGRVISDKLTEQIPTEEFMERCGLTEYPTAAYLDGQFAIIDKTTGTTFKALTTIFLFPPISQFDFIIYASKKDQPNVGSLSVLTLDYNKDATGQLKKAYIMKPNVSEDIAGTPKSLTIADAKNVSPSGSVTAITQEGDAPVFSASTLKKVWDIGSQFSDGTPENFKVSARRDQEISGDYPAFTWIATQDGRVFTRQTGKNYLGGKFITEPYYLDEKGYKITHFGHTLWGITNIPCYDEKNRRVLLATSLDNPNYYGNYRSFMTTLDYPGWTGAPIMNMPEDTEVFYLTNMNSSSFYWDSNNFWYQIYYNTGGKSMVGTFAVDNRGRRLVPPRLYYQPYEVTGHTFTKETVFLTAAATRFRQASRQPIYDLFSEGNKIFAVRRSTTWASSSVAIQEMPFKGITSKITFMTYDRSDRYYASGYFHLIVGCENGDVLVYLASQLEAPQLAEKYNVGGKVVGIKQLGMNRSTLDLY
ncbi:MAG TPA: hypothetical protein VIQ97_04490 [Prevotella sp.]